MANLTETEITNIRQRIGDHKTTTIGRQDLTDAQIQADWDRANGHASQTSFYLAHYYMLERRYGIWINATDTETTQGSKAQSQKPDRIEKLLLFYAKKAGVDLMIMQSTQGTFDFGLDQDDPITGEDLEE